ncbi:hypothetical protein SAMN04487955_11165 [Halomonas korlensis]|uniref:Uncharacterized protein n=1 Tax=Halomonas korlensis TaxID=463301 RepID=A0A1I7JM68_9GAMM|nr:hypothetical protein SAMN04487955_11165 [Halomonas korlensis]
MNICLLCGKGRSPDKPYSLTFNVRMDVPGRGRAHLVKEPMERLYAVMLLYEAYVPCLTLF